jgi:putative transposase
MGLAVRKLSCCSCGLVLDRDRNAAANLAAWAEAASMAAARALDRQAGGRVTNASGGEGTDHCRGDGETSPIEGGTDAHAVAAWQRTPEKGAAGRPRCEEPDRL